MKTSQLQQYSCHVILYTHLVLASLEKQYSELYPEDAKLNSCGLATKYGHSCTQYDVITEDGYILTLFRLPGKKRDPILLTHGFQDSSDTWLMRGKGSLAITLADEEYDLWLCNLRGNRYSRRHLYLNPNTDDNFWNYSFHEQGYYDLPVIIDKVLNETNVKKLTAIGHSQGNTIYYVLGSTRTHYNSKINVMIALSPICYFQNTKHPISIAVKMSPLLNSLAQKIGFTELLGDYSPIKNIWNIICPLPVIGYMICAFGILFPLGGYDPTELEPDFLPVAALHFFAGSSWKTVSHFLQVGYRKEFARFDYGPEINNGVYNISSPPVYDLKKVTMPVALIAGRNDHLSTLKDIALLRKRLPNVVSYIISPRRLFNHPDAIWGKHMNLYLYPQIFKVLNQYLGMSTETENIT